MTSMTERGMVMMKAKRSKSPSLGNSSSIADLDDIAQYMIQKKEGELIIVVAAIAETQVKTKCTSPTECITLGFTVGIVSFGWLGNYWSYDRSRYHHSSDCYAISANANLFITW
jgi:hypothetical protein